MKRTPIYKDVKLDIQYDVSPTQQLLVNNISGFYGLIGPHVNYTNVKSLYKLFTGDGVIQGVFFNKGKLSYVKHFIRTDKVKHEDIYGRLPINTFASMFVMMMHKLGMAPNILGLANTAMLRINEQIYALFERDVPYLLNVDFSNNVIETVSKVRFPMGLKHFSAHSKAHSSVIETIDCDIFRRRVNYYQLNSLDFSKILKTSIQCEHLPITHDFLSTDNSIVITDSALKLNVSAISEDGLPIILDQDNPTYIRIINKSDYSVSEIKTDRSFFLFHYADYIETNDRIEIYACLYDRLSFSSLNIDGKYRKIIVDKRTNTVEFETRDWLEALNLDFPVKFEDKVVFRRITNGIIDGLVICRGLDVVKYLSFPEKFICGEHSIAKIDGISYLFVFTMNVAGPNHGFLNIINLTHYEKIEIPIPSPFLIGFHSIFTEKIEA